jgi:two-component system LytT family sensor kinase
MKALSIQYILDQRKIPVHILIAVVSILVAALFSIGKTAINFPGFQIHIFLLILIQCEAFLFIASRVFRKFSPVYTRKEVTRIIIIRFSLFFVISFFTALIIFILFMYFSNLLRGYGTTDVISNFLEYEFKGWFKSTIGGLLFGAGIFLIIIWQDALKSVQKLVEQNLIFQNETLKNQVNPHFLFNSLNTLSSLVSTEPEMAEKFINRLSSIYRYILENCSRDRVSLELELAFIRDYFFLHKIRDDEKIELEIQVSDPGKLEILPISLQGLVENAIKHNKATREEPLKILIFIEGKEIAVKNNLQKMASQIKSTGIGLKNLSERVKLLTGKDLFIEETNTYFLVKMPLLS